MAYKQLAQPWLLGARFRAAVVGGGRTTEYEQQISDAGMLTNSQYLFFEWKRYITMSLIL